MGIIRPIAKRAASTLVSGALVATVALTGCSLIDQGSTQSDGFGTATTAEDRKNWTTVSAGSNGVWSTILLVEPVNGNELDAQRLRDDIIDDGTISWSQIVYGDNKSTQRKETAYVFLTTNMDYSQIKSACSAIKGKGWDCSMLDATTYSNHVTDMEGTDGSEYAEYTVKNTE